MKHTLASVVSLICLSSIALLMDGCADTKMKQTWSAPDVGSIKFTKVFVLVQADDDFNRRLAENAVLDHINKVPGVASYEMIPANPDAKDKAKVLQAVKDSGADGVVALRIIYRDIDVSYGGPTGVPMDYAVFSDYLGTTYDIGAYYEQDRRQIYLERIFGVETRIYDVKSGKLLWMGRTQSKKEAHNDHDVAGLANDVGGVVKKALASQKLID